MTSRKPNLRGFDLNLITIFEAIIHHKQLSSAAQELGMTQPAMSSALARLRIMFKDQLFVRSKYGMLPTPKAEQLFAQLQPALTEIRGTLYSVNETPRESTRRFTIIAGDYFEKTHLVSLLNRIEVEAPHISISIKPLASDGVPSDFKLGRHDFALYRRLPEGGGVEFSEVGFERLVVIASQRHPRVSSLSLSDFCSERHVLVESASEGSHSLSPLLATQGVERDVMATVTSFGAAALVVENSNAICTVPEALSPYLKERFKINVFPFPAQIDSIDRLLMWPAILQSDPMHAWLRGHLYEILSQ
jgi:DNA-binding transcriptional LysR family regulator